MQDTGISSRRSPVTLPEQLPDSRPKDRISAAARVTKQIGSIGFLGQCLILSFLLLLGFLVIHSPRYICDSRPDAFSRRHVISIEGLDSDFGLLGVPWWNCLAADAGFGVFTQIETWANCGMDQKELLQGLEEFVPIYETRPIKNNMYGMGFDHSFGLWFMTRQLKPDLVVESGAFKGHSTWVLRQAVPDKLIISLSPRHPEKYLKKGPAYVDGNCTYYAGKDFIDFGSMDWSKVTSNHGISDLGKVVVFFDDHQNELKRLKQALKAGFRHLIFEDNYDTGTGDHYSFRQMCDQFYIRGGGHSCFQDSDEARIRMKRKRFWDKAVDTNELCAPGEKWWGVRGQMRDNFNHSNLEISHTEHFESSRFVESVLDVYWELPPVAGPSLTHQTRYDPARTVDPIVEDGRFSLFQKLGLTRLEASVFNGYTQMVYLRVSPPSS